MTQLIATPNNETASVTLDILKTADVTKVVRSNVNGTEEVRVSQGQLPSSAVSGVVRTNLITNPSFETDLNNWSGTIGKDFVRKTTGGVFGTSWMQMSLKGYIPDGYMVAAQHTVTLTGGKTYVFSFYTRTSITERWYTWVAAETASDAVSLHTEMFPAKVINGWTRASARFTIPGTGPQSIIFSPGVFQSSTTSPAPKVPVGTTVDYDGVLLEEGTTPGDYFDGDTADISGFDYTWSGTPHASTSKLQTIGGRLILTDYEAAHGLNTYNVYAADGSMTTGSATLVIDDPWLSVPVMPQYSEQVQTITQFGASREANTTVHKPLGRADSLVVMGKLGDRTGSMEIYCDSYAAARRLERVFERGEVVQLRQRVSEMDMYFTVTSIPVSPYSVEGEDATRWAMVLNYVEVRRPIGTLAGALGWTFDTMASSAASFDVITAHYSTFDALTLGDANV